MSGPYFEQARRLTELAQQKLSCLKQLQEGLEWFCGHAEEASAEELIAMTGQQQQQRNMADSMDSEFGAVLSSLPAELAQSLKGEKAEKEPYWLEPIRQTLRQQREVLTGLVALNRQAVKKNSAVSLELRKKIKQVHQQRQINPYQSYENNMTGIFLNYKEGK